MHRVAGPVVVVVALSLVLAPSAAARPHDKLVGGLGELARGGHPWAKPTGPAVQPLPGVVRDGRVLVDVYVTGSVSSRAEELRSHGMSVQAVSRREPQRMVEGWLPVDALEQVAALPGTRAIAPIYPGGLNATTSEGDAAHHGPQARALGPTGTGIAVGVISDSIDKVAPGVDGSQASGDLPPDPNVVVLNDSPAGGSDEGRAMAEIVYDTAPGIAKILFSRGTGTGGAATRVASIDALVAAGARIVVDDTFYLTEPFFQDGIVAQAADRAKAGGAAYIVSAGNRARQSWEGVFTPTGDPALTDFDPGPATDTRQTVAAVPSGRSLSVVLQWDDPFGAVTNDYAIDVYDADSNAFLMTFDNNNVTSGIPRESFPRRAPSRSRSRSGVCRGPPPRTSSGWRARSSPSRSRRNTPTRRGSIRTARRHEAR